MDGDEFDPGEKAHASCSDDGFQLTDPVNQAIFDEDLEQAQRSASVPSLMANLDESMARSVNSEWQNLVSSSIVAARGNHLLLPWERGFAARVLTPQNPISALFPALPCPIPSSVTDPVQPEVDESRKQLEKKITAIPGAWQVIATRLASLKFHRSEEDRRQVALAKWKTLLMEAPELSRLGRQLLLELLSFRSDGHLDQVLLDVFSRKATGTLNKRADNLLEFFHYCMSQSVKPLPLSEGLFYAFLREVRAFKAPTAPKTSRESIAFSEIVGFDGADSILQSERIRGLCHRLELTKRVTKKAKALTRKQVIALERIMMDPSMWLADRVKAAHDLFATFGRLRWRDSQWLSAVMVDRNEYGSGYLECETTVTKTSTTAKKKTTMLPVAVPLQLLETQDFAKEFLSLREKAGLPAFGELDDDGRPLPALPSVDRHGEFTTRPLTTAEAGKWTRELLTHSPHAPGDPVEGISSHSFKTTTLSWVSKHGSCSPYERKILGYHADSSEDSMHCYSRDVIAEPLRKYSLVIQDVSFGIFEPDSTRSGYFPKARGTGPKEDASLEGSEQEWSKIISGNESGVWVEEACEEGEGELEPSHSMPSLKKLKTNPQTNPAVEEDSEPDSESNSSSSDSDEEDILLKDLVPFGNQPRIRSGSKSLGTLRFVHARLKTVHAGHELDSLKLACGRPLHGGFRLLEDLDEAFPFPRCQLCFGKQ